MMMGWWSYIGYDEKAKSNVSWRLIRRVLTYAKPYRVHLALTLLTILAATIVQAIQPQLFRQLIDSALPNKDSALLDRLALGIIAVPLIGAAFSIIQRYLSARMGEG